MTYHGTATILIDGTLATHQINDLLSQRSLADVEEHARNDGSTPGSMLHEFLVAAGFDAVSVDWRGRSDD